MRKINFKATAVVWMGIKSLLAIAIFQSRDITKSSIFTELQPGHLLAYFPLQQDTYDYAPVGAMDGFGHHAVNSEAQFTNGGWNGTSGLYLNGNSSLKIPIDISSYLHPQLTIGAWVNFVTIPSKGETPE